MPAKPRILVVGSSNTDLVVFCDRLPNPGETVLGGEFQTFGGGKGANQAVAAARAGGDVAFLGAHGADTFGTDAKARLHKEGINTDYFQCVHNAPSGVALILVDGVTRENLIAVAKSTNDAVDSAMVSAARPAFEAAAADIAVGDSGWRSRGHGAALSRARQTINSESRTVASIAEVYLRMSSHHCRERARSAGYFVQAGHSGCNRRAPQDGLPKCRRNPWCRGCDVLRRGDH